MQTQQLIDTLVTNGVRYDRTKNIVRNDKEFGLFEADAFGHRILICISDNEILEQTVEGYLQQLGRLDLSSQLLS